ncbi:hypothetical protein FOQG_18694 [Fusarium oxysporum f. sp. raphani 54005]|uniref:Uncharacterized protein n=2 Tax=Fusarium oxysporum TaxID=5507 RepID=X0C198_FUSOX|nr:hypothetical protein FOQG_18694 [Fusarium oxysporum f. sp. raphani 54005]EXM13610.1 hypothetical protein FOTG_17941 [Fusarium oxysporum f. sp. vasinfectum 25433]
MANEETGECELACQQNGLFGYNDVEVRRRNVQG